MGIRVVAGFACVLGVWAGPVRGDDGAVRAPLVQLASIAAFGGHVLEQRLQGASVRIPERAVAAPPLAAPVSRVPPPVRPALAQSGRKLSLSRASSHVGRADAAAPEAVAAGYQSYFGRTGSQLAEPLLLAGPISGPPPEKTALWTVFSGPAGLQPYPKPGRDLDLGRPAELLLALKAGF